MKRKYITKQEDVKDCGAACISSILKYYNGYVPMETIRKDTFTNTEGTTAYHLVIALRKYNFDANGYKIDNILDENIVLPVIAHVVLKNNLTHFVVIYKIDKVKKTVLLMDPAYGYKTLSIEEFNLIWTKVLLVMIPKSKIPKYQKPATIINLFWELLIKEKKLVISIILISFLLMVFSIISSFYIKIILNNLDTNFKSITFLFLSITFLKIVFEFLRINCENKLNKNIDEKMVLPFLKHLFYLPLSYVKTKTTGEIITRVRELNNIKNLFSKIFITFSLDFILASLSMFFIYKLNVKLFLILCFILIIYFILSIIFSPVIKRNMENIIEDETSFNSILVENIDGLETIKNNNRHNIVLEKTNKAFVKYLDTNFNFGKTVNKQKLFQNALLELGIFLITTIGLYYISKNTFSIADLITFNALLIYILDPVKNIVNIIPEISYVKTSFTKINEFISLKEERLIKSNEKFVNGNIELKNVSYSYNHYNYILENYNLFIKKNEKIMLKGESGSGKSTICKLINHLYNLDSGAILINDKDLKDYNLNTIRNNIVYLSQKERLFTDTIKNNIIFSRNVSDDYYQKIIKICRVNEIFQNKPFKDNTMLTENGFNLSGGETQRIILARALLKKADIIILDEALSEVESSQETLIIKDILSFFKDKTIIYVTHRNKDKLFDRVVSLKQSKKVAI